MNIRIVSLPKTLPEKWDLADPVPKGISIADILQSSDKPKELHEFIISAKQLHAMAIVPRECIVEPFILTQSLNMIYAKPGIGKTWMALQLGISIANGWQFLHYNVPKARRVLLIDGEMPLADLQKRLRMFAGFETDYFDFLPSESLHKEDRPLNIQAEEDRQRIKEALAALELLGRRPEMIIFDNLSSLSGGVDENSNTELDDFMRWMVNLRHEGYCLMFVHHAGKSGDQRGASRRTDLLDTVIKLSEPKKEDKRPSTEGAHFVFSFDKTRGERPVPFEFTAELMCNADGKLDWGMGAIVNVPKYVLLLRAVHENPGLKQGQFADIIGVKKARISQIAGEAEEKGLLLRKPLRLTREGQKILADAWPDEFALPEPEQQSLLSSPI
ncbi:MAG: AAA family ATPase [Alphaproteobacteria bacterium]